MPRSPDRPFVTAVNDRHDAALRTWRAYTGPRRALVHLDAHLDCEPIGSSGVHIGNVLRAAMREQLMAEVFWIVPDPVWGSDGSRRVLGDELRRAGGVATDQWHARIEDVPVSVMPLAALPSFREPVHLDVDVDYLFFTARGGPDDRPAAVPWCWPDGLVAAIELHAPRLATATISSSVTGGFTPLRWKHLARELALRLCHESDATDLAAWGRLARAAGMRGEARLLALERIARDHPENPAVLVHLADDLQAAGRLDDARAAFARAVAIDGEYRHLYRTQAPLDHTMGRRREAEAAYRLALDLDPEDPFSRIGLGQIAEDDGRLAEARRWFEEALARPGGQQIEAYRGLARVVAASDPDAAIAAYERSLALAVRGVVPLSVIPTSNIDGRIIDPAHARTYAEIARLHADAGRIEEAVRNDAIAAAFEQRSRG
jgi:tetratricopeptide (TPR) repeat protein